MKHYSISHFPIYCSLLLLALTSGCATGSTSNTARTSTEQLLLANAVDQSLDKVNFTYFAGSNVFLQEKYIDCVDKNYIIASTRHRLLNAGAHLVDAPDKADVVVEMRNGAVGTNSDVSFIGTPEIALPGMLTIPEVKLAERRKQQAVAKFGLVAYDPKTSQVLGTGGTSLSNSVDSNWFIAGVGPFQTGAIRKEVDSSTTGPAAQRQAYVPVQVTFAAPNSARYGGTQMASEPAGTAGINPVSHEEKESKVEWAK